MPAGEVHYEDIGVRFIVTLKDGTDIVDVSSASPKQIKFHKPDGTVVTKTADFYTDGTDGKITYITESGDINQVGNWKLQSFVGLGSYRFHSDVGRFTVYPNLE
jgi:hypothetical protein